MLKKYSLAWKLIPFYLVIGFLLGYFITRNFGYKLFKSQRPVLSEQQVNIQGNPVRVVVPDLGIDIAVVEGDYQPQTKKWNVSGSFANFATVSSLSNTTEGNTVIYGHNTTKIFGRLYNVKPGTEVFVYTGNSYIFKYRFVDNRLVDPTDTTVFSYTGKPILTLITCWGTFNQKRDLMTFSLEKASKI